jgi:precorrin-2 dehydrogenase / sirohydrochlorin ferrochelatase
MKYYPIQLNIEGRPCMVIGGGEVGERKVFRLLECGAQVTVISKTMTPPLETLRGKGRIACIEAVYEAGQIDGAFLVIGATDDEAVNDRICKDCRHKGIMVNIVDDPARCDFILPALCERGDLSITVSTAGKSPALAKQISRELAGIYGEEYAVLVRIMGALRERVVAAGRPPDENREIFENLLQSPILSAIKENRWEQVRQIVLDVAGIDADLSGGG